jgi:hypothetical protein
MAENGLAQLQRAFADAIFFDHAPIPSTVRSASGPAHVSRFGVYRNNVIASLINAVAARYPVVRKLLWDDAFDRIARLYIVAEPPRSPVMLAYGESFPQFLRAIGQCPASDYLADVAALESARTQAYHAADATPLPHKAFSALAPEALMDTRLSLHPSVRLLRSHFPVVSIWEANLHANDNILSLWKAECALISRPHSRVEVRRLTGAAYEFLAALADRHTVGTAIARAMATEQTFDLAECFAILIGANIVIGMECCSDLADRSGHNSLGISVCYNEPRDDSGRA